MEKDGACKMGRQNKKCSCARKRERGRIMLEMIKKRNCLLKDALEQGSSTFRVRGPIYIFHIILRAAVIADYKIIMDILNIIIGTWAARQVTWVNCL